MEFVDLDEQTIEANLRKAALEEIIATWVDKDIVLLGDPGHGLNSIQMLIEYQADHQDFRIHTLFMENINYDDGRDYALIGDGVLQHGREDTILRLIEFCDVIIGLETEETTGIGLNQRCGACLPIWSDIIKRNIIPGNINIACVGTAHLVRVDEVDDANQPIIIQALSQGLLAPPQAIPLDRIESYAVVDYDAVNDDADNWQDVRDEEYRPQDGLDTLPFLQYPFIDIFLDDGAEGIRRTRRKSKRSKRTRRKKSKKSKKRKKSKRSKKSKKSKKRKRSKRRKRRKGKLSR